MGELLAEVAERDAGLAGEGSLPAGELPVHLLEEVASAVDAARGLREGAVGAPSIMGALSFMAVALRAEGAGTPSAAGTAC